MANIDSEVKSGWRTATLVLVGGTIGGLLLIILFTSTDMGSLFKGQIAQGIIDPKQQAELDAQKNPLACSQKGIISQDFKYQCGENLTWEVIKCKEGAIRPDGSYECKNGEWIAVVNNQQERSKQVAAKDTESPPPILEPETGSKISRQQDAQTLKAPPVLEPEEPPSNDVKILTADVSPSKFNPLINEAKITYKISAAAKIDVVILDSSGKEVVKLVDNVVSDAGEYSVWWNGTDKKDKTGKAVSEGKYTFKITAKRPEGLLANSVSGANSTNEVKDSKSGIVEAVYPKQSADFKNKNPSPAKKKKKPVTSDAANAQATVVMQNSKTGKTSGTGPETLIYLIFPLAGFLIPKRAKGVLANSVSEANSFKKHNK
ncbi:hypothetical protein HZC20_03445 [Candidatus Peregrinibacteria bacterium]|nr:hypothetical protein [Candidatus Peregrinibacteria bacterium]